MSCKSSITIIILCTGFTFTAVSSFAGDVFIGFTAQQSTLFISDKDTQNDLAEMENNLYFIPTFAVRSGNNYFHEDFNLGYFLEFNSGYYIVSS